MKRVPNGILCERARAWASLAPDGELAELERKLLNAHLERCASCASFAAEVVVTTAELRRAPLVALSRPVHVPTWRRSAFANLRNVGAAAAVALMAVGVASRAPLPSDNRPFAQTRAAVVGADTQTELAELRQVRRQELISAAGLPAPRARHFGNQPA